MATIISIVGQKGGIAKTTTAANFGGGLSKRQIKTLLIDLDPQGSLSQFFGINNENPDSLIGGDWLLGRKTFDEVVQKTAFGNLWIVPSNDFLKEAENHMHTDHINGPYYLHEKIQSVRERFDFIIVDTLPGFSLLFVNSLVAGDHVLVPVKLEKLSINSLAPLQAKIEQVQRKLKPSLKVLGIVGTFYRKGVSESVHCEEGLRQSLGANMLDTVIHQNTRVVESVWEHKPIQYFDHLCQGSMDYEALTNEILNRVGRNPAVLSGV